MYFVKPNYNMLDEFIKIIKRNRLNIINNNYKYRINTINKYKLNKIDINYTNYSNYMDCNSSIYDNLYDIPNNYLFFNKQHIYSFIIKYHQISKNIFDKIENKNKTIKYLIKYSIFR